MLIYKAGGQSTDRVISQFLDYEKMIIGNVPSMLKLEKNMLIQGLSKSNTKFQKAGLLKNIAERVDLRPIDLICFIKREGEIKLEVQS